MITSTIKRGQHRGQEVEFGWAEETGLQATRIAGPGHERTCFGDAADEIAADCDLSAPHLVKRIRAQEAAQSNAAAVLGRKGGNVRSDAQKAHRATLHTHSPHTGRAKLVWDERLDWTHTRIWATRRGYIVQFDSMIQGTYDGQRYALDYSDRFPAGMDMTGQWNESEINASAIEHFAQEHGRCLSRGTKVR